MALEWTDRADSISTSLDPIDAFKAASDSISSGFGGLSRTAFNIADQALARARNRALMSENTDEFDQNMAYVLGATGGASNEALSNLARNVALDRATVDAADLLRAKRAVDEKQNAVNAAFANEDIEGLRRTNAELTSAVDSKGRPIRSDALDPKAVTALLNARQSRASAAEGMAASQFARQRQIDQLYVDDIASSLYMKAGNSMDLAALGTLEGMTAYINQVMLGLDEIQNPNITPAIKMAAANKAIQIAKYFASMGFYPLVINPSEVASYSVPLRNKSGWVIGEEMVNFNLGEQKRAYEAQKNKKEPVQLALANNILYRREFDPVPVTPRMASSYELKSSPIKLAKMYEANTKKLRAASEPTQEITPMMMEGSLPLVEYPNNTTLSPFVHSSPYAEALSRLSWPGQVIPITNDWY